MTVFTYQLKAMRHAIKPVRPRFTNLSARWNGNDDGSQGGPDTFVSASVSSFGFFFIFAAVLHILTRHSTYPLVKAMRALDAAGYCYTLSIKEVLKCANPDHIVPILREILEELGRVGLAAQNPYLTHRRFKDGDMVLESQLSGMPNIARLSDALLLAQEVQSSWSEISRLGGQAARIQAIESIRQMIQLKTISRIKMPALLGASRNRCSHLPAIAK
jgi:hypothetical protein